MNGVCHYGLELNIFFKILDQGKEFFRDIKEKEKILKELIYYLNLKRKNILNRNYFFKFYAKKKNCSEFYFKTYFQNQRKIEKKQSNHVSIKYFSCKKEKIKNNYLIKIIKFNLLFYKKSRISGFLIQNNSLKYSKFIINNNHLQHFDTIRILWNVITYFIFFHIH